MAKESKLELRCREYAEYRGGELLKWVSPGNTGVQDRILLLPRGFIAFIEFKAPDGKLDAKQEYWFNRMYELGQWRYVIDDYETFRTVVDQAPLMFAGVRPQP